MIFRNIDSKESDRALENKDEEETNDISDEEEEDVQE